MERLLHNTATLVDQLFFSILVPCFQFIGQGLENIVLRPLDLLQVPLFFQVVCVAGLTVCCSLFIRRALKVQEKERAFRKSFATKKAEQQNIDLLGDWKTRDVFYRATDQELDEDFNTYLAQRFARHTMIYLLPIFLTLFWLDQALPVNSLVRHNGIPFLLPLPPNSYGAQGLSVPFVFLTAYLTLLLAGPAFRLLARYTMDLFLKNRRQTAS